MSRFLPVCLGNTCIYCRRPVRIRSKRQILSSGRGTIEINKIVKDDNGNSEGPVSYTHLDVYKRQVL